ncbi:hypothetical protein DYB32_001674 [Aphanomyces invadans]|uniref:Uncharacterized protein n=1 Tax=Aphanomyces invadans TaxID=157072 RepID=A0A418B5L3_9STRA|nr:hypothetical protein DYB32_001674 [Aphanomyces invadans]
MYVPYITKLETTLVATKSTDRGMQQSPSGGSVADARPPALEWRPYGVLLLSGSTKVEKTAKEKLLTVLSGSLTPRERGVFKVIKRVDLALDGKGADPDALAGAFYKMLDQDRIEYTTPKPPPPATAVVPPLATPPTATPANPPLATAAKPTALPPNTSKRENSRKTSSIDLNAEDESPEEDLLPAAAVALEVDLRTGSPSHIYVFVDYPASVAEVKSKWGEAKPLAMLTRELKTLLANLAVDKLLFKTWLSSIQIIPVPTQDALPEKQMDALKQTYADILDVLYEPSVGVSAIVYAMTETVVKSFVKPAQPPPLPTSSKKKAAPPAGEPKESSALSPLPKVMQMPLPAGRPLDDLEKSLWLLNDLPGVGHGGRKGMPVVPTKSFVERSIDDTELMQFHSNRVILGRGTVVSTRKDNSQAILYASGRMAKRSSPTDTFVTVDEQGVVTCGKNQAPHPNVPVHIDVDPETRAVIATRDDGVIVVTHPNGYSCIMMPVPWT